MNFGCGADPAELGSRRAAVVGSEADPRGWVLPPGRRRLAFPRAITYISARNGHEPYRPRPRRSRAFSARGYRGRPLPALAAGAAAEGAAGEDRPGARAGGDA